MSTEKQSLRVDETLDVRGVERVKGYTQVKERLVAMPDENVLEVYLDEGEPLRSIPYGLRAEGHEILVSEPASAQGVRLLVRKRPPLE